MKVKIKDIHVPEVRASSRLTPEQQAFLQGTVEKYGVLQPILVRPLPEGGYELIAGKTRLEELKRRGFEEIEVKVVEASSRDALLMHLAENYARGTVEPISTAQVIEKALEEGCSVEEVARIFNHKPEWVRFMVSLLELPEVYQQALKQGKLKVTHIREAFRLPDLKEVDAALSAAITHGWSTGVLHHYVNNRLAEHEAARIKSEMQGVAVAPPPPEPERLVRYTQCMVCSKMVPRGDIHLPQVCKGCYELARYVTSQFGTGDQGMQNICTLYQRARAWEALQKPIFPPGQEGPHQVPGEGLPTETKPSTLKLEKSQPIEDEELRSLIKKMIREEMEGGSR